MRAIQDVAHALYDFLLLLVLLRQLLQNFAFQFFQPASLLDLGSDAAVLLPQSVVFKVIRIGVLLVEQVVVAVLQTLVVRLDDVAPRLAEFQITTLPPLVLPFLAKQFFFVLLSLSVLFPAEMLDCGPCEDH